MNISFYEYVQNLQQLKGAKSNMSRVKMIKSEWNGIDKKDISALDISWLLERSERTQKLEHALSDVHWLLLEATDAYTNNCDFKVNYKINEAITLIEELAKDES